MAPRALRVNYGRLPLSFEPNRGQSSEPVKFLSRGAGYTLFLTNAETVLEIAKDTPSQQARPGRSSVPPAVITAQSHRPAVTAVLRTRLVNASRQPVVTGEDPLPGKSNYFLGNDRSRWRTNIPTYRKVRYRGVYPGIDLLYYGSQRQLEYDFVVAPGANPQKIAMEIRGARSAMVNHGGDLVLHTPAGAVQWRKPTVYQVVSGHRQFVACRYSVSPAPAYGSRRVSFSLGGYDQHKSLVIDPVLAYSTYFGGVLQDQGYGIAVDSVGNAYVTGAAEGNQIPNLTGLPNPTTWLSAFVSKIDSSGSYLIYSTLYGSSDPPPPFNAVQGLGIAVDQEGDAYITGVADGAAIPTVNPLQASPRGAYNAFVAKLGPTGSTLIYSTYLGGSGAYEEVAPGRSVQVGDYGYGIAVDSAGNAFVTGWTPSADFPTQNPFQASLHGTGNAFVAELSPSGSSLVYSTYLGGSRSDGAYGIALDTSDDAYVTGWTNSPDFPTSNPLQSSLRGSAAAFITKLSPSGASLVYSTYLGGSGSDGAEGVAVDSAGNAFIAGWTSSADFPTQNPFQASPHGTENAFVAELSPSGSALVYSTYLGGSGTDLATGIALDASDNVYVTGWTNSRDFPTSNPLQPSLGGNYDAFVAKLDPSGSSLIYSTYLGGSASDYAYRIAVDTSGNAYIIGFTYSVDFPTEVPLQAALQGEDNVFVAKISTPSSVAGVTVRAGTSAATTNWNGPGDRDVQCELQYGLSNGYGSTVLEPSVLSRVVVPGGYPHSISVSGLQPGSIYHFRILGYPNNPLTGDLTFTTLSGLGISNVTTSNLTSSSATITWNTSASATSQVDYGPGTNYGITVSDASLVSAHSASLVGLLPSTLYHYRVSSSDANGTPAASGDQTFVTSAGGGTAPSGTNGFLSYSGVTHTRSGYTLNLTITNNSPAQFGTTIFDMYLTALTLGPANTPTALPISIQVLFPGQTSISHTVSFPLSAGNSGSTVTLAVSGTQLDFLGNVLPFYSTIAVKLP